MAFDAQGPYDLEKETHGEWLTITRRKKNQSKNSTKPPLQLEGLKASVDRVNSEMASQSAGKKGMLLTLTEQ